MRNPAIHITMTVLADGLAKLGIQNPKRTAVKLIELTSPYAIKDRYAVQVKSTQVKRATRAITAAKITAITTERFNGILHNARVVAGHRAIAPIRKTDSQWTTLTEIAAMASEFAKINKFDSIDKGCQIFVQLGLEFMKRNYGLNKFKYYKDAIYAKYTNTQALHEDTNKSGTEQFTTLWVDLLEEYTNIRRPVSKVDDRVHILNARIMADELEADYEDYIRAQFEQFALFGGVPNLNQLYTDNAEKRYIDYMTTKPEAPPEKLTREDFFKDL